MSRRGADERPINDPLDLKPSLGFSIDEVQSYQFECDPLGPYYRLRFFNKLDSVMLTGNREQTRQIRDELTRALDLGAQYKKSARAEKRKAKAGKPQRQK